MKRAFIVHGWSGSPDEHWLPWLSRELEQRGFLVSRPAMPAPDEPQIETWVAELERVIGEPDSDTYLIGHSIGCQTIMRYLEKLPAEQKLGGVVFVAGFFHLPNLETEEEKVIAKPWLETPIDLEKVKNQAGKFVAIFSDDDPDVSLLDKDIFAKELSAEIIVEHAKGHFTAEAGVTQLPSALKAVLTMVAI